MVRSAGAVASGIIVLSILSFGLESAVLTLAGETPQLTPHSMSTPSRAVVSVLTLLSVVAGGYVTAWLARRKQVAHATAMGVIMLAMTVMVLTSTTVEGPGWLAIASTCLLVPAAWAGGKLCLAMKDNTGKDSVSRV
jgi:hypothetical protein